MKINKELKSVDTIKTISFLLDYKGEFTVKILDGKVIRITGDFGVFPDIEGSASLCKTCERKSDKRFCHAGIKMSEFKNMCNIYSKIGG